MGASWSAVDIDEPFAVFQQWAHAHSVDMLKKYRENDFDFGIDGKIVAFLIGGDVDRANDIVDRFAVDGSSMYARRAPRAARPLPILSRLPRPQHQRPLAALGHRRARQLRSGRAEPARGEDRADLLDLRL